MYSSRSVALNNAVTLKLGWTRHLAVATMVAVNGPVTPLAVKKSAIFGVSLNGIGLFASNSPRNTNTHKFNT